MNKSLRLDGEAGDEIEAAAAWYHARRPELGGDFLAAVRDAFTRIPETPSAWALVPGIPPHLGVRRFLLRRFPFSIVYIELEAEIRVLAVAHGHREPGYWRRRI